MIGLDFLNINDIVSSYYFKTTLTFKTEIDEQAYQCHSYNNKVYIWPCRLFKLRQLLMKAHEGSEFPT